MDWIKSELALCAKREIQDREHPGRRTQLYKPLCQDKQQLESLRAELEELERELP